MYGKENKWGHHTKEARSRIGKRDEEHPFWKGDEAGYASIHAWVKSRKLKSKHCEKCKKMAKRLELSNNSGKCLRDINDYEWLCVSCHRRKDLGIAVCHKCKIKEKYKNYHYCKECNSAVNKERYKNKK